MMIEQDVVNYELEMKQTPVHDVSDKRQTPVEHEI